MAHDLKTICDNLAAKFAPGAISTPAGALDIRASFGQSPNSLPALPAVYIEVDDGEVVMGGGTWDVQHNLVVNFVLAKASGDTKRVETNRQLWLVPLLQATFGDYDLGATAVKSALPAKYEFAEITHIGELYDGIRIFYQVLIRNEAVSLSA